MSDPSQNSEPAPSKPKPFSIALSTSTSKPSSPAVPSSRRTSQPSSQGSTPRHRVLGSPKSRRSRFQDDGSDNEGDHPPTHEAVTGFDHAAGGAISAHKREAEEKAPLVIKVDSRNNWQEKVSRARKSWLPPEVQAQRAAEGAGVKDDGQIEVEGPSTKAGLSYAQRSTAVGIPMDEESTTGNGADSNMVDTDTAESAQEPQTQEEIALQTLIRESKGAGESGGRNSNMIIETQRQTNGGTEEDETNSFRADVASRPDAASLADYSAVPVEEFGAALLRGMGWKEGEPVGRGKYGDAASNQAALTARVPDRRPGYLGIGAKEVSGKPGSAETELGAWGKSAMRKAKKPGEGLYTPVLMRSKKTGEQITEDEFKAMQKKAEKEPDEWKERRDRNLQKHGRDSKRRDHEEDVSESNGYRRSASSSKRDGSLSPDRDRRRRKQYDDDDSGSRSDDRRYRDRDRDRESRRERDRDRDRRRDRDPDRESSGYRSSRRHDTRTDGNKYRSSDRGRDRDRDRRVR